MIQSIGFTGLLAAFVGFYGGVMWIETTQTIEIDRLNKQIKNAEIKYEQIEKTITNYKATIKGKDNSVAQFCKAYGVK